MITELPTEIQAVHSQSGEAFDLNSRLASGGNVRAVAFYLSQRLKFGVECASIPAEVFSPQHFASYRDELATCSWAFLRRRNYFPPDVLAVRMFASTVDRLLATQKPARTRLMLVCCYFCNVHSVAPEHQLPTEADRENPTRSVHLSTSPTSPPFASLAIRWARSSHHAPSTVAFHTRQPLEMSPDGRAINRMVDPSMNPAGMGLRGGQVDG